MVAGRRRLCRALATVEIHRDHAASPGRRLHAGAGLAAALARFALSLSCGADRTHPVPAGVGVERRARLGLVSLPASAGDRDARIVAAHARRLYRPAIRTGRPSPAAGHTVGLDADRAARISRARAGRDPAVDRGACAFFLFPLEVALPSHRRHLAHVHVASGICRRRRQCRHDAAGRLERGDHKVDDCAFECRCCHWHRDRCDGISSDAPTRSAAKRALRR